MKSFKKFQHEIILNCLQALACFSFAQKPERLLENEWYQDLNVEMLYISCPSEVLDIKYYQEILQVCEMVLSGRYYLLKNRGSLLFEVLLRQFNPT